MLHSMFYYMLHTIFYTFSIRYVMFMLRNMFLYMLYNIVILSLHKIIDW